MSTRVSAANLIQAMKDLSVEWQQAKEHWRDAKSHEFERHYLEPLPREIARATTAIEEIDALLRKVRSDCE
jgi:hypothetical protein